MVPSKHLLLWQMSIQYQPLWQKGQNYPYGNQELLELKMDSISPEVHELCWQLDSWIKTGVLLGKGRKTDNDRKLTISHAFHVASLCFPTFLFSQSTFLRPRSITKNRATNHRGLGLWCFSQGCGLAPMQFI